MGSSLDRYLYVFIHWEYDSDTYNGDIYDSDICLFTNLNSATSFKGRVFIFIVLQELRTLYKKCENMAFYWPVVSHTRTKSRILPTCGLTYKDGISNFTDPLSPIEGQNLEFYWPVFSHTRTEFWILRSRNYMQFMMLITILHYMIIMP